MKRFYNIKRKKNNNIYIFIILVIIVDIFIFNNFYKKLGNNVIYYANVKIDELTRYYLNNTIKKYLNVNTNDYIKINIVNNNIVNVDIDNNNTNILLNNIINDLENNVKILEKGHITNYHNLEMIRGNNGIIILLPSGVVFNNPILSNLGPSIPIKINFLENINAYVDVVVENYGINNSLIKLYVVINIEEVLEIPMKNKHKNCEYKFLISSKLINGEVPNIFGGNVNSSSKIVKNNVN